MSVYQLIEFDKFSQAMVEFADFYSENNELIKTMVDKYGDRTQHLIDLTIGQLQYFAEWESELKSVNIEKEFEHGK